MVELRFDSRKKDAPFGKLRTDQRRRGLAQSRGGMGLMEENSFNIALFLAIYNNKAAYTNLLAHMSEQRPDFDREKTEHIMELIYEAVKDDLPDGWRQYLSESDKETVRLMAESSQGKAMRDLLKLDMHDN